MERETLILTAEQSTRRWRSRATRACDPGSGLRVVGRYSGSEWTGMSFPYQSDLMKPYNFYSLAVVCLTSAYTSVPLAMRGSA